jgi:hypothetical protein
MLFAEPHEELTDEAIVDVLRQSIINGGCDCPATLPYTLGRLR